MGKSRVLHQNHYCLVFWSLLPTLELSEHNSNQVLIAAISFVFRDTKLDMHILLVPSFAVTGHNLDDFICFCISFFTQVCLFPGEKTLPQHCGIGARSLATKATANTHGGWGAPAVQESHTVVSYPSDTVQPRAGDYRGC